VGVKDFFESMSESNKDLFYTVVNSIQASAPKDKIDRLDNFLQQLRKEIDQTNAHRQMLGSQVHQIEQVIKHLVSYAEQDTSLEISLFLTTLQKIVNDLKIEIAALRPENKLEKKFDVARRKESLEQRRNLVMRIEDAFNKKD